jgi:ArsR family transcriptional regulator
MPRARRHPSPGLHAAPPRPAVRLAVAPDSIRDLSEVFALLSSETRLRLLLAISKAGELHVRALADAVGMRIAAVSNQLRLMARAGVLGARSEGLRVLYSITDPSVSELLAAAARIRA